MAKTIGFIGGGQMAEAIIKGLLSSSTCRASQIKVTEPLEKRRAHLESTYHVATSASATETIAAADTVILAVKPQVMPDVLQQVKSLISRQLVITIAAGLPLSFYEASLGLERLPLIRVMPNMGALVLEGASALSANEHVRQEDLAYAETLFGAIGSTVIVEERLMDGVTGLSGSGPAFVFTFIEALIDGGIKTGLSRDIASELAIQTVLGAAVLAKTSATHPALLRAQITSPGGTTISGLHTLAVTGFPGSVMSAVEAACKRSIELGETYR